MKKEDPVGSRLVITQIGYYARNEPNRAWAAIPKDDEDLTKGFQEITYRDFASAIENAASWLEASLPPATCPFEAIAYLGPKDARYPIVALAVAKIRRKLLLPSPFASVNAQTHLLQASHCTALLYAGVQVPPVLTAISESGKGSVQGIKIPNLSDWLWTSETVEFAFGKTADEIRNDPWLIFHTSGTTGVPKLITYTHAMMASLDAAELMPDAHEENFVHHFTGRRWYTPLPSLHFVGMTVSLQFPVLFGGVVIMGPATPGPTTPTTAREVITYGKVQGVMFPPALIDGLCNDSAGLECLRNLDYVYFAGAPISRKTVDKLMPHVPVKPAMGSSEAGAYFLRITGDEDWEYYSFRPGMGMQLQPVSNTLYEAVFVRNSDVETWQQVFKVYPELNEFHTKDLFSKHPTKPDSWKYVGRTDDMIVFSHGEDMYAAALEEEITSSHAVISAALIGGHGRPRPFLLIQWKDDDLPEEVRMESLLPILERVNRQCSDLVKLSPELIISADSKKKLVLTTKGTVSRKESEALYEAEIARLYDD